MARKYTNDIPSFISIGVSNVDESARWVLDYNQVAYIDSRHPPGVHILTVNYWVGKPGLFNNPVYLSRDNMVYTALSIAEYFETVCAEDKHLFPADPALKQQMLDFVNWSLTDMAGPVSQYAYGILLPRKRITRPLMNVGARWWEKLIVNTTYCILAKKIKQGLQITTPQAALEGVKAGFAKVEQTLSDGRKYLMGDEFTFADVMCASNAAPVILPSQFGGTSPTLDTLPPGYKKNVEELRQTPTGQFVTRIYNDHRPPRTMPPTT